MILLHLGLGEAASIAFERQEVKFVMDILFFPYFSCLFLVFSMHICPFHGLSHFLCAAIILLYRHFLISPLMWLTGMSLWSRYPAQPPLPIFISILCRAMLFISVSSLPCHGYATAFFISACFYSQGCSPHSFNYHYDSLSLSQVQDMDLYNTHQ